MPRQCLSSRWLGTVSLSSWFINLAFILSLHCASSFSFNWWWATKPTRLKKFRIYTVVVSSKPMDSSLVKESHQTSSSYLLTLHATRLMLLITSSQVAMFPSAKSLWVGGLIAATPKHNMMSFLKHFHGTQFLETIDVTAALPWSPESVGVMLATIIVMSQWSVITLQSWHRDAPKVYYNEKLYDLAVE